MEEINMRKEWFKFVSKTRAKMQRKNKNKTITHKEAMATASKDWTDVKLKLLRKKQRLKKKMEKTKKDNLNSEDSSKNVKT